jgi:hypothetical protein
MDDYVEFRGVRLELVFESAMAPGGAIIRARLD